MTGHRRHHHRPTFATLALGLAAAAAVIAVSVYEQPPAANPPPPPAPSTHPQQPQVEDAFRGYIATVNVTLQSNDAGHPWLDEYAHESWGRQWLLELIETNQDAGRRFAGGVKLQDTEIGYIDDTAETVVATITACVDLDEFVIADETGQPLPEFAHTPTTGHLINAAFHRIAGTWKVIWTNLGFVWAAVYDLPAPTPGPEPPGSTPRPLQQPC